MIRGYRGSGASNTAVVRRRGIGLVLKQIDARPTWLRESGLEKDGLSAMRETPHTGSATHTLLKPKVKCQKVVRNQSQPESYGRAEDLNSRSVQILPEG
jgi:hypothetical protein